MGNSTAFSFQCSIPPEGTHFVRAPPVRGTLDIVWACLGVIVLSTWDAVPLQIRTQPRARSRWGKVKSWWAHSSRRLGWALYAVIAPEIATAKVIEAWQPAREVLEVGKSLAEQDGVDWTLMKAYYAELGGFCVVYDGSKSPTQSKEDNELGESNELQPLSDDNASIDTAVKHEILRWGLQLIYLRQIGVLDSLPSLTTEELDDRNKANFLVQTLAFIQTMWLVLQLIARLVRGLSITQLEIITLAFAVLRFITMLFDWDRPKNVNTSSKIHAKRNLTASESQELTRIADEKNEDNRLFFQSLCLTGILFGALHCLAWNEEFPTTTEQTLWRVAAVSTTVSPLIIWLGSLVEDDRSLREQIVILFAFFGTGIYILARLIIIAETVRTIFYQPPSAFISTWTASFPHIG